MAAADELVFDRPAAGVTRLRINRPGRRGALSPAILAKLCEVFAGTEEGCILLTGTGEVFSAGYDLGGLGDPIDPETADATIAPNRVAAFDELARCRVPVLAALNGPAIGGGLELALGCDVRLAVPGAYLAAPAGRLGLVYAPGGLARVLAGLPEAAAAELFVLGRSLDAGRAHALGVLTEVVEPRRLDAAALDAAGEVLAQAPLAVTANARALRALRAAGGRPGQEVRDELAARRAAGVRSADFAEGVRAFRERRDPRWRGR